MFASEFVILDLETTGMSPGIDRVTEVAVLRVRDGAIAEEWSTLVNPGRPIPAAIRLLTGISDAMVAAAPCFADVAAAVGERIDGATILVAHNARFDYGFLKAEFARAGIAFSARTLCTVRLSRALYPQHRGHGLDAIIDRHALTVGGRHRALGDARMLWEFIRAMYRELPAERIEEATRRLLQRPSLPAQLPPDALDAIPHEPGVYIFYGTNRQPLYVGKSVNLRERVGAHFSGDHRSERDLRLSQELVAIEHETTPGELGALLRESALVKLLFPAHNLRLRRRQQYALFSLDEETGRPRIVDASETEVDDLAGHYGVFNNRGAARKMLASVAQEARLCHKLLGLETGAGPCFAYQLKRCLGACVGAEPQAAHLARLKEAIERYRIPAWPHGGAIAIGERRAHRESWHVFDRWCYLGSAATQDDAALLTRVRERRFDADAFRILTNHLRREPDAEVICF